MFVAGLAVLLLGSLTEGAPTGNIATGCVMMQHNDGKEIGVVKFEAAPDGTMVSFSANMESDIIKVGKHGFHVHQDPVQGVDCVSTGGHYNPTGKNHGSLYGTPGDLYERHVGDLGNILAGDGGIQETVSLAVGSGWEAPFTLEGEYSIIGHSVVLHADQDDLGLGNFSDSKTTGHAGARLACCTLV